MLITERVKSVRGRNCWLKQLLLCHRLAGNSDTILVILDSRVPTRVCIDNSRLLALKPLFSALLLEGFLEVLEHSRPESKVWCWYCDRWSSWQGPADLVLWPYRTERLSFCLLPEDCNDKSGRPLLDHSVGFGPVPIFRDRRKRTVTQVRMQNIQVQHYCYLPVSAHHFVSGILITDPAHALLPRYTYQRGAGEREQLQFHSMHQDMEF